MTDTEIEQHAPWIPWRAPIAVTRSDDGLSRWGCRYCIARHGLTGRDIDRLFLTREAVDAHLRSAHPRPMEGT